MNLATFASVALGFVGGIVAVFLVGRRIVAAIVRSSAFPADRRALVVRMAAAGAFVGFLPSLILGTVLGATLGGVYGQSFLGASGAGSLGLVAGVALGTFAVVALVLCLAITIGAYIGVLVARRQSAAL